MDVDLVNQLVCSTIKIDKRMSYYGDARIMEISVLSMIYELIACYTDIEHDCLLKLQSIAQNMVTKSEDICNLRGSTVYLDDKELAIPILRLLNHAPTVDDDNTTMVDGGTAFYNFIADDFKVNFTDADGDLPELVRIVTLPVNGTLRYNGVDVVAGLLFNIENATNLIYERLDSAYVDTFIFQTSDNNTTNKLFSNMATFTITVDGQINQPPVVGDGADTTAYGETLVFTRADFTTNTTPPYSDPEGDAEATLKITVLPAQGNIKLNGVNISAGDEFDFTTDIDSGNLTYVPDPGTTTTHMPVFTFGIADAGSGIFSY